MPFFIPAKNYIDCVSLQVSRSALNRKSKRKRVYLFTSKGSISIEASIAISIFLMVVVFVESYLMYLNTEFVMQTKINNVVVEASKNMFYVASINEAVDKNKKIKEIKKEIYELIKIKEGEQLSDNVKKSYLTGRLIQEIELKNTKFFLCQVAGINTAESSIKDGVIDLVATYKMQVPLLNKYITLTQRGRIRAWQGVDLTRQGTVVYITRTGSVYHTTTECMHLSIRIKKATYEECKKNYRKCNLCVNSIPQKRESVYITEDGEKYHSILKCKGLVRNIITVSKDEIKDMKACSDCGGGEK